MQRRGNAEVYTNRKELWRFKIQYILQFHLNYWSNEWSLKCVLLFVNTDIHFLGSYNPQFAAALRNLQSSGSISPIFGECSVFTTNPRQRAGEHCPRVNTRTTGRVATSSAFLKNDAEEGHGLHSGPAGKQSRPYLRYLTLSIFMTLHRTPLQFVGTIAQRSSLSMYFLR